MGIGFLDSKHLKESLVLRITMVFSTIVGLIFLSLFVLLINREHAQLEKQYKVQVLKQVDLVMRSNEALRIENNLSTLAHKVWSLDGVGATAFFDKDCRLLYSIPQNFNPVSDCNDKENTSLLFGYVDDRFTKISTIFAKPSFGQSILAQVDWVSIATLFFVVLLVSVFFGTLLFQRGIVSPMGIIVDRLNKFEQWDEGEDKELPSEFWTIGKALSETKARLKEAEEQKIKLSQSEMLNKVARQVAHDIRSPVSALHAVANSNADKEKSKELLSRVTERIQGIAEDLLKTAREHEIQVSGQSSQSLGKVGFENLRDKIQGLVAEKGALNSDIQFDLKTGGGSSGQFTIEEKGLLSSLSNLIDNSVQADAKSIQITLEQKGAHLVLSIKDDGQGIPQDILAKLGHEKISFGKENGNGIGVLSTATMIRSWGGEFNIESEPGNGTAIRISVPKVPVEHSPVRHHKK